MGRDAAADAADGAQVLVGLAGGEVDDVRAVEPCHVDRLAERVRRLVEVRADRTDAPVAVEIAGAGEQGADADAVEGAGGVGADPTGVDEGLEQLVHAAARHAQFLSELVQARGLLAPLGEQFQQRDGPGRRLHTADTSPLRHGPIVNPRRSESAQPVDPLSSPI